jgi:hypothetical protein
MRKVVFGFLFLPFLLMIRAFVRVLRRLNGFLLFSLSASSSLVWMVGNVVSWIYVFVHALKIPCEERV